MRPVCVYSMLAAGDGPATLGPAVKASALLVRWEEARQQGREVTAEALCPDLPELHEPLPRLPQPDVHQLAERTGYTPTEVKKAFDRIGKPERDGAGGQQ